MLPPWCSWVCSGTGRAELGLGEGMAVVVGGGGAADWAVRSVARSSA